MSSAQGCPTLPAAWLNLRPAFYPIHEYEVVELLANTHSASMQKNFSLNFLSKENWCVTQGAPLANPKLLPNIPSHSFPWLTSIGYWLPMIGPHFPGIVHLKVTMVILFAKALPRLGARPHDISKISKFWSPDTCDSDIPNDIFSLLGLAPLKEHVKYRA